MFDDEMQDGYRETVALAKKYNLEYEVARAIVTGQPIVQEKPRTGPKVITLCGSTRFPQAFELAMLHHALMGHIVIGVSMFGHADKPTGAKFLTSDGAADEPRKIALDQLHFRKIDISDEIHVINVGGYIGSSTRNEIEYAKSRGVHVTFMFPE